MRQTITEEREYIGEKESFGDLLSRLATASAGLVRDEIDLAKKELQEKAKTLRTGIIAIAAGAILAIIALFTLDAAAVVGLGKVIGYGWSALAIGIAIVIIAAIIAGIGAAQIKRTSLKLEETLRSLKEDRDWLKRIT
jgi:uncharacterized membrane protein YqjE